MRLNSFFKRGITYLKNNGIKETLRRTKVFLREKNPRRYEKWIKCREKSSESCGLGRIPLISVCMPVYDPDVKWLRRAIESVKNQSYAGWELCIADDCSKDESVRELLKEYAENESRIRLVMREKNGGISEATNSAVGIAKGEYIALLDNDDELATDALLEIAALINENRDADVIYSDEDKIDTRGRRYEPFFKPDYCPDTLLSLNYISHLGVYRKELFDRLGGFRKEYDGSQDYDLALRFADVTHRIYHIPKVLYHWRVIKGSTSADMGEKSYAYKAARAALEDTIRRRGYSAEVLPVKNSDFFEVRFFPGKYYASIIIPVKDKAEVTERCLNSIYEKTDINKFEIIIADNGSVERETAELFEKYRKYPNFHVLRLDMPFNFSRINNIAARSAKGDILVFLNNDTEVIWEDWLDRMAGEALRPETGCVGAKLLYPNEKVQHCGIILGALGLAGHIGIGADRNDKGYFGRYVLPYNCSAVTAACLAVRKSLFLQAGGFDEGLAVAFNDVDFCLKVMDLGVNNIVLPSVELFHHESLSRGSDEAPEKKERFHSEIRYLKEKWGEDRLLGDPCYNMNMSLYKLFLPSVQERDRKIVDI